MYKKTEPLINNGTIVVVRGSVLRAPVNCKKKKTELLNVLIMFMINLCSALTVLLVGVCCPQLLFN